jgi:hypothetical protein
LEKQGVVDASAEIDALPQWELVQRIIVSPQFIRAARLRTFLQYVTRCALLDRPEQVNEQQIGIHVFGKPPDYNASEDNVVRSQARFLRIKLAEYFESEPGRSEPVILTIPKGTYLPHFSGRIETLTPAAVVSEPVTAATPPGPHRDARRAWIPAAAVVACLAGAVMLWQWYPARATDAGLWARLFEPGQSTTIVASDYIFSMVQEAAGRTLSLDEYLGSDYFNRISQLNTVSGLEHLFPNIAQRHYTGFENVTSVARLMSLKQSQSAHTVVRFARDLTMRDVGAGNIVLIGSKQSNPWVLLFEPKLNFRFEYQVTNHSVFIANHVPRPGEPAEYRPSPLDEQSREIYGGIAFLPNLNRGSNVLILQGTSMAASEAALEILDNPAFFRDLIQRVRPGGRGGDIPYFEAIIRARTLNGVAAGSTIVASRVLVE